MSAEARKARVNFRPVLFCALGMIFGIDLYVRCRFGGFSFADIVFFALLLLLAYFPVSWKRLLAVTLPFLLFAGMGAAFIHLYTCNYLSCAEEGEYSVAGTVVSFTPENGYTRVRLNDLTFDGLSAGGSAELYLSSEEVRTGDRVSFEAAVTRTELPANGSIGNEFLSDIRYRFSSVEWTGSERSSNLFLLLNGALYDVTHDNMGLAEADVSYALLTGNSSVLDETLSSAVRTGGIAHIFAVSGLHIGILYAAVFFLCRPLKRLRFLPATALALCYSAVCAFSVSSLRAVIMCAVLGLNGALGRKHDFINSIAFAATAVLLLFPAQWFAAGFRLSFGACAGLALFSGSLSRGFKKLPASLGGYLSANLSVQTFTFPILVDSFGYFSVWGFFLNFLLIPLLPVLFLTVLLCSLLSLAIAPAAAVLMALPSGMVSAFLFLISLTDFFVLTGFTLGAGGAVWMIASVLLSERVRMGKRLRAGVACGLLLTFALILVFENAVVTGCKWTVGEDVALLQTTSANVLVLGEAALSDCEGLLNRSYAGTLDAVVIVASDELAAINVAAFLPADAVYAREEIPTGLRETELVFAESFCIDGLEFRFEGAEKLSVQAEGTVTEFDFANGAALDADLFVGEGCGGLIFYLKDGIIYAR